MKAVILAGGIGSRMGKMCENIPKPMIELCGKPVLLHQIEALKKEGITDFIIVTGYLSEKIEGYFGDGKNFSVNISYYKETEPLGTAGALFKIRPEEDFLLCNGDLIFDFDLKSMITFHKEKNALATLLVHPNSHPYDSLSLIVDDNNQVTDIYEKNNKPEFYPNLCNAGIEIVSPELLTLYDYDGKVNLDRDVIGKAIHTKRIFAYKTAEYVHDMGTPERHLQTGDDILSGKVSKKNKRNLQKAIFVDRDGTLNKHKGFITSPDEIELIDRTGEAVRNINDLGYIVIIITNQPVIARGECSYDTLEKIHNKLEMLLAEKGAFIDGIYFCPHHPHSGFEGEVKELKIQCNCRKPSPGMIFQAQKEFNINLSESYMVGDMPTDAETARNAGCIPVLIGEKAEEGSLNFSSLYEFSEYLKGEKHER